MTGPEQVVDGFDDVVAIARDRHGIPRVRATSVAELFVGRASPRRPIASARWSGPPPGQLMCDV